MLSVPVRGTFVPVCVWQAAAKVIFLVHHFDFHTLQLLSPSGLYQREYFF